jgi:hypothetical protein
MKPEMVFETGVRELGECGGHFWTPHMKGLKN